MASNLSLNSLVPSGSSRARDAMSATRDNGRPDSFVYLSLRVATFHFLTSLP